MVMIRTKTIEEEESPTIREQRCQNWTAVVWDEAAAAVTVLAEDRHHHHRHILDLIMLLESLLLVGEVDHNDK